MTAGACLSCPPPRHIHVFQMRGPPAGDGQGPAEVSQEAGGSRARAEAEPFCWALQPLPWGVQAGLGGKDSGQLAGGCVGPAREVQRLGRAWGTLALGAPVCLVSLGTPRAPRPGFKGSLSSRLGGQPGRRTPAESGPGRLGSATSSLSRWLCPVGLSFPSWAAGSPSPAPGARPASRQR